MLRLIQHAALPTKRNSRRWRYNLPNWNIEAFSPQESAQLRFRVANLATPSAGSTDSLAVAETGVNHIDNRAEHTELAWADALIARAPCGDHKRQTETQRYPR
jgi:hypothetical protein